MSLNTDEAVRAFNWFADQRFLGDMHVLEMRANQIRRDIGEKIHRDFQRLRYELLYRSGHALIGVDPARGDDRTVFSILKPREG